MNRDLIEAPSCHRAGCRLSEEHLASSGYVMRNIRSAALLTACCALWAPAMVAGLSGDPPQDYAYELPSNRQVIAFVLQSIEWYRHTYAERQIANDPVDLLFLDDNHPIETQIVRFSFDFAKADAALASRTTSPKGRSAIAAHANSSSSDLARFIRLQTQNDAANEKAAQDLETLKRKLVTARGPDRAKLQVAAEEAQSRSELLRAESNTINDLVEFAQSAAAGQPHTGDLSSTIEDLVQTVPEVSTPATSLARQPGQNEGSKSVISAHDGGIIRLWSDVSSQKRKLRIIDDKIRLTNNLARFEQNMRDPMSEFISQLIQGSSVRSLQTGDIALLNQDKMRLDALTSELNSLSPAIVALDKQRVLLALYKSHLEDWRNAASGEYRQSWKRFCVRLLIIALITGLVIGVSELSRRVTERHVQDPDRRRRIGIAHQLLMLSAVLVVVAVGFASDLSSMATYFGLMTAGMAVALQNVIVASVGYLMLVGKRGIRVGDRVRISGITGDVIDIGLLQFQLREFDAEKQQFTKHVATFSNSLVFVSPGIGLVKFNPAEEEFMQEEVSAGHHLHAWEAGDAAVKTKSSQLIHGGS